jgi:hypothetical protein
MQTFHIILNILNMPKDSQNICNELKSTVVCRDNFISGCDQMGFLGTTRVCHGYPPEPSDRLKIMASL